MSTQQTAITHFLDADGIKYAYRLIGNIGNTTTPPLLLLNHIRSTIDLWDPAVVNPLATSRQVILFDYAGNGHSGGPVATSIPNMAKNLISFLTVLFALLNISQVDVLGFSIGGFVTQQLALDAPNLVNKLILSGTQPGLGPELANQVTEYLEIALQPLPNSDVLHALFNPPTASSQAAATAWIQRIYERNTTKPAGETFADFLVGADRLANLSKCTLGWFGETSQYALLPGISKEVLVTAGHSDALVPTHNAYVLSQRLAKAFFLTYPDSGHGHLFQFADLYTRQVIEFLDGKWSAGATGGGY